MILKNIFLYNFLFFSVINYKAILQKKFYSDIPFIKAGFILFVFVAFTFIYAPANYRFELSILAKYRRFLYPAIIFPIFYTFQQIRVYFLNGLCISCWLIISIICLNHYGVLKNIIGLDNYLYFIRHLSAYNQAFPFINPIYGSLIIAYIAYLSLYKTLIAQTRTLKIFYSVTYFFSTLIILWFQEQNTGFWNYTLLMVILCLQHYKKFKLLIGIIGCILIILIIGLYRWRPECSGQHNQSVSQQHSSSNFQDKILITQSGVLGKTVRSYREVMSYIDHPENNIQSQAIRLDLICKGISLWKSAPFLGHGVGSYPIIYSAQKWNYLNGTPANMIHNIPNPHNQYILILVEFGLIGICVFGYWIISILKTAKLLLLDYPEKSYLYALLATIGLSSFADCILFLNTTSEFIIVMICWILSASKNRFQERHIVSAVLCRSAS